MIAAIPAEDQPIIIEHEVFLPTAIERVVVLTRVTRSGATCLSCGAKTDQHGALPCGH